MNTDTMLIIGAVGIGAYLLYELLSPSPNQPATTLTQADAGSCLQAAGGNATLATQCQQQMQTSVAALAARNPQGAADYNCLYGGNILNCFKFNLTPAATGMQGVWR